MASSEHDREDLFLEAAALTERIELRLAQEGAVVTAGFRDAGAVSIFWNDDPVWHFNSRGELRRAFDGGVLYKAELGRLAALERRRDDRQTALLRTDLADDAQAAFLWNVRERLAALSTALTAGRCETLRSHPPATDVLGRLAAWLGSLPDSLEVAAAPNVR
jgi:hypothetical protein